MLPKMKLVGIINQLKKLAEYQGDWEGFLPVAEKLRGSLKELEERSSKIDALLIVAIVGGSGVGKSTLINAIAGDKIAKTSEMRPCTERPIVYYPPNWTPDSEFMGVCELYARSALDNIVLIDTPDTDTIIREHRNFTKKMVEKCDLILLCGNQDKYLEETTWSIIREVSRERGFVLVETKMESRKPSIMEDWLEKLRKDGVEPMASFRVNALRALDRKLGIKSDVSEANEFDFQKLESFLTQQLTDSKIRQIKTANVYGLIEKMIERVDEFLHNTEPAMGELKEFIEKKKIELVVQNKRIIRSEFKRESVMFYRLLKDEITPDLHGSFLFLTRTRDSFTNILGTVSKVVRPWKIVSGIFQSEKEEITYFEKKISEVVNRVATSISSRCEHELKNIQYELAFALDKAKIHKDAVSSIFENFKLNFFNRGVQFLAEKIDYHLVQKAKCLSNYFLIELFYVPVYIVLGYFFWRIIPGYFLGSYQGTTFIIHSCLVLLFSVLGSFWLYDKIVYFSAQRLRRKITKEFIEYLPKVMNPFVEYEKVLNEIEGHIREIYKLKEDIKSLE